MVDADELKETLAEMNEEALLMPGFDEALIGIMVRCGKEPIAVYAVENVLGIIIRETPKDSGMTYEDALEHFHFSIAGAWVGDGTPGFVYTFDEDRKGPLGEVENDDDGSGDSL